VNAKTRLTHYQ